LELAALATEVSTSIFTSLLTLHVRGKNTRGLGARSQISTVFSLTILVQEPDRPRPTTLLPPRSNCKPEATTAVYKLLMMGKRMPETCWAVFNDRQ